MNVRCRLGYHQWEIKHKDGWPCEVCKQQVIQERQCKGCGKYQVLGHEDPVAGCGWLDALPHEMPEYVMGMECAG